MGLDKRFWKNKRVLLTGHTGFKGSWLSLWLQEMNADIVGFSNGIPTKPSMYEIAKIKNGMTSLKGNVCNYNQVLTVVKKYKPEIIFHMAAQSLVRESYTHPLETYATNMMGTANVLEAIRMSDSIKVGIIVTSDKCYKIVGKKALTEEDPIGGYDPYSSSKGCAELITSSYRNSFFNIKKQSEHNIGIASVRAGNVIGGGDWNKDRLIPDIIKGIINKKPIKIRNPDSIRPWQHVLDPLYGYMMLAEKLWKSGSKFSEAWNFGPDVNESKTVKWIVKKIIEKWPEKICWIKENNMNKHEEEFLKLNCTKAKTKLGWIPKLNTNESLEWVVEWYKNYEEKKDMREITEQQIKRFQKMVK
ncbi:MAG: CDP-glucose 4,6-dehydratase [Crenarchaeota archaeon]|nr:MAG: CDP-glucose 4,6-dehydratase [Thermoproteota archaeon]RDJ33339.1 MAG: CDP-glucose 4,6-dehydratase [Thermoproteota archaeon]RDJ36158.1 MAG: CDP-glucose 4,6-dehydratase [Thermoproteota archaeon]RDJ39273.1 MAG: CDP-glucose 4,6-dehydratase [Thermoproteota archaeon]